MHSTATPEAVYAALTDEQKRYTTPQNVAAVLAALPLALQHEGREGFPEPQALATFRWFYGRKFHNFPE